MPEWRHLDSDRIRAPAQGTPEFLMTGFTKPDGTVRIYASRRLQDVGWGQRLSRTGPVLWHLDANLDGLLIVDKPTWQEALARVMEIWANQEREDLRSRELDERRAIASGES